MRLAINRATAAVAFEDLVFAIHSVHAVRLNVSAESAGVQSLDIRVRRPDLRVHAPKWIVFR